MSESSSENSASAEVSLVGGEADTRCLVQQGARYDDLLYWLIHAVLTLEVHREFPHATPLARMGHPWCLKFV